jgi:hypothetical protein
LNAHVPPFDTIAAITNVSPLKQKVTTLLPILMPGSGLEIRPLYNNKTGHFRYDILIGLFPAILIVTVKNAGCSEIHTKRGS